MMHPSRSLAKDAIFDYHRRNSVLFRLLHSNHPLLPSPKPESSPPMDYDIPKPTGQGVGKALLIVGWMLFALSTITLVLRFYTKGYRLRRRLDTSDWCMAVATVGVPRRPTVSLYTANADARGTGIRFPNWLQWHCVPWQSRKASASALLISPLCKSWRRRNGS